MLAIIAGVYVMPIRVGRQQKHSGIFVGRDKWLEYEIF